MKAISVILFILVLIFGCSTNSNIEQKPVITVSILPQKYLLEKIAGDRYNINVMIQPGVSHETYDPSPSQLQQLSKSKAYFMIGHIGFEKAWIKKIASVNKSMRVYDLSAGITLISSEHNHTSKSNNRHNIDPHIWLSPESVKVISYNMYNALKEIIPSDSLIYKQNYADFLDELDSIDREIRESLSGLNNRKFFIYHPALTYFARDYKLEQIPIELEGKSPSPYHLKQLINLAKKENIKIILIQEQFDIENAKVLADEIEGKIVKINPLDEDWLGQLMYITYQLQTNLSDSIN